MASEDCSNFSHIVRSQSSTNWCWPNGSEGNLKATCCPVFTTKEPAGWLLGDWDQLSFCGTAFTVMPIGNIFALVLSLNDRKAAGL